METSNIASTTPPLVTKQFLENVLQKEIVGFQASAGSKPGDNFMCVMTSLDITLKGHDKPLHLLLKTFPNHRTRQKILEETNTQLKEYQMYSIYRSELINFQKSVIGNETIVIPPVPEFIAGAAIDYSEDPSQWSELDPISSNYLLMVDVRKAYGFQMADKFKSLDYHQVKTVMGELAKYHALGYAYKVHYKLSSILEKFPFFDDRLLGNPEQRPQMVGIMKTGLQLVKEACSDFLQAHPEIAKAIKKFEDPEVMGDYRAMFINSNGIDEKKAESLMRRKSDKFSGEPLEEQWLVPGHGDCWTNNILFKNDQDGNAIEGVLVDLQETREGCVMVDIVDLLYSSTDAPFRKKYGEEMMQVYFEKFQDFCKILKVEPWKGFTPENLQRKFHRSKIFGFVFASFLLPIVLLKPDTNMDVVGGNAGEDWAEMFEKMGKTARDEDDMKRLRERFTGMLLELQEEGIL